MESEESGKLRALRSLLPHAAWLLRALVLHELSCPICFHALYASSLLCSYAIRAFVIHVASVTCLVPRILCHVPRVYVLLSQTSAKGTLLQCFVAHTSEITLTLLMHYRVRNYKFDLEVQS